VFFNAVAVRNAAESRIEVMNGGWHGSRISDWLTSTDPWSAYNGLITFGQALTILCCNINDARNGTDLATYQAGVLALLTRAREAGDAVLMTSVPSDPATVSYANQKTYVDAAIAAARQAGAGVVDVWRARGGTYNPALMTDDLHPNWLGYQDVAAVTYGALGSP
jgi:lysophospholipase L1-like esterase